LSPEVPGFLPAGANGNDGADECKVKKHVLLLSKGRKTVPVRTEDIICIIRRNEVNHVYAFNGQVYLDAGKLEDLYAHLDEGRFFRVNRQSILQFSGCEGFSSIEHGKIEVLLPPSIGETLVVSQKNAAQFRQWMDR